MHKKCCNITDSPVHSDEDFLSKKFLIEPGAFRNGQLVIMSINVRSVRKRQEGKFPRSIEVVLRGLTLVGRAAELVSTEVFYYYSTAAEKRAVYSRYYDADYWRATDADKRTKKSEASPAVH